MHITGQVTQENHFVRMGAFHTLDLEMNRDVKIIKEEWDSIALQRVEEACAEGRGAEVGAIVCGEGAPQSFCWGTLTKNMLFTNRNRRTLFAVGTHDNH